MLVMALCEDGDDKQLLREQYLQAHLDYVELIDDKIAVAGPLKSSDTGEFVNSLFIYDVESLGEARHFLEKDPYYRAGVYSRVELTEFYPAIGTWIGGRSW